MTALGENLAALNNSLRHNRTCHARRVKAAWKSRISSERKKIVVPKCLASNWTNCSFVLRKLLAVRCYVLLKMNDGFFSDRPLFLTHVNKYKGQTGSRGPCSSHCGLSKWRGLAVKACFAKQPRDSSSSEWCVKSTGLGGLLLWDFNCS